MACHLPLSANGTQSSRTLSPRGANFAGKSPRVLKRLAPKALKVKVLSGSEHQAAEQQLHQAAAPASLPASSRRAPPVWLLVPGLLLTVAAGARAVKAYLRKKKGSMGELENRGYLDEERGNKDPYLSDAMKNVNTVNYEPLSKEQIEAARKRRMQERDQEDLDIEKLELPENHPWAVKQQVTKDEEELQKARLTIRRGAPLQDLTGKRGFPEDPRSRPIGASAEQALR